MPYAIRFMSPIDAGMLVEMPRRELIAILNAQEEADELREAYWDTPEPRHHVTLPPETFPRYERVSADKAHGWVRCGYTHETALYVDSDKRVRRAHDGEY